MTNMFNNVLTKLQSDLPSLTYVSIMPDSHPATTLKTNTMTIKDHNCRALIEMTRNIVVILAPNVASRHSSWCMSLIVIGLSRSSI